MNCTMMYAFLLILLCLINALHQEEITASYTTTFRCSNGSYALIHGADLTLEYDYGYSQFQLESFHINEKINDYHMFGYEKVAGQAFIKSTKKRWTSYEWTETGIRFSIPDIDKNVDLGVYEGKAATRQTHMKTSIEIKHIFDPPAEVKITTPSSFDILNLKKGFNSHVLEASAESYPAIACNSVMITWVSSTRENVQSCQAKDERATTVCQLSLNEIEMTAGECMSLQVYAKQYGVQSEKKAYTVCYDVDDHDKHVIVAAAIGVLILLVIIVIILIVYLKRGGKTKEVSKKEEKSKLYQEVNHGNHV